ncbi:MAG: hypothetical protein ACYCZ7_01820 [Minisyncoccota bacterium]
MEHLTKSQIVLLTLFVSFVSSMATGIVVVTLMQQAPEPVLQSITNVVERTIEKVTPTIIEKPGKQVIIKDEDLMVAAIERNAKSVVALRIAGEDGEVHSVGIGTIITADGLVVTDKGNFGGGVLMTTIEGVSYALEVVSNEKSGTLGLGRLTPVKPLATSTPPVTFTPATLGDASTLKVGQTAIVIGGRDGKTIATSLISDLDIRVVVDKETKTEAKFLDGFSLSERLSSFSNGAPIITLGGAVMGFVSIDDFAGTQIGIPAAEAGALLAGSVAASPAGKKAP